MGEFLGQPATLCCIFCTSAISRCGEMIHLPSHPSFFKRGGLDTQQFRLVHSLFLKVQMRVIGQQQKFPAAKLSYAMQAMHRRHKQKMRHAA